VKLPTAKLPLHLRKKKVYLPVILPSKAGNIAIALDRIRSVYVCNNKARPKTFNIHLKFTEKKREKILMPIEIGRKIAKKYRTRNYSCIFFQSPYMKIFVEKKAYLP